MHFTYAHRMKFNDFICIFLCEKKKEHTHIRTQTIYASKIADRQWKCHDKFNA